MHLLTRLISLGVAAFILLTIATMQAPLTATRVVGPPDSYNQQQRWEYWIGGLAGIMRVCGYGEESTRLKELANLSPYARKGLKEWFYIERYAGNCSEAKSHADNRLSKAGEIRTKLSQKYPSGSTCCVSDDAPYREPKIPNTMLPI